MTDPSAGQLPAAGRADRLHLSPRHRETLEALLREHLPGIEVWAYGSRVNGESHDGSDLDLVLRAPGLQEVPIGPLIDFTEALHDSTLPFLVEARDWTRLPERFHKEIERGYVVIQNSASEDDADALSDWCEVTLGEIAEIVGGSTPSTKDLDNFNGEIPWLTPKDLSGIHDRYISRGSRNLSQKGLDSCSAKLVPANTVLLSTRAPIGYVAIAANPISTNQGFRNLVTSEDTCSEFIYYWLKNNTETLERYASGSTFREISGSSLKKIRLRLPPFSQQRAIAHILGTLDDKIELNRRMNETLEAMARALFKSWFVDFDPVRAKMQGRWRPGESLPGLPAHLYDLFPDRLVDSELGDMPEGWEVKELNECMHLTMGQSPPGNTYNDNGKGLPFFQGRTDFGFRYPTNRKYCTAPTRIAECDDTLVSVRAPVGDINMAWEKCCAGRGVAVLRHRSGARSFTYYSAWAIQQELRQYEHSGTVFGAINKKQFEGLSIVEPTPEILTRFESQVGPIDDCIRKNVYENRTLVNIRDLLLPNLMSGEVRLREAPKTIEAVA